MDYRINFPRKGAEGAKGISVFFSSEKEEKKT